MVKLGASPEELELGFISVVCKSVELMAQAMQLGIDEESFQVDKVAEIWNYLEDSTRNGRKVSPGDIDNETPTALTIPLVALIPIPSELPIATTHSPTCSCEESPI